MTSSSTRRGWLYGGVALVAAAAGVGGAWWTQRRGAGGGEKLDAAFWAQRFERPEGGEVVFDSLRGKPLVVNFWATWCPPCVKELPEINQFYKEARGKGWQVLGLAVDKAEPVQAFLQKTPLDFAVALAGADGLGLVRELGNPAGGLPFSVVFDDTGEISWRRLGVSRLEELRELART